MHVYIEDSKSKEILFTVSNGEFKGSKGDILDISGKGKFEVVQVIHTFSWANSVVIQTRYDSVSQVGIIVRVKPYN